MPREVRGIEPILRPWLGRDIAAPTKVSVHGWTLSKRGGPEGANRMFATGGQFPCIESNS